MARLSARRALFMLGSLLRSSLLFYGTHSYSISFSAFVSNPHLQNTCVAIIINEVHSLRTVPPLRHEGGLRPALSSDLPRLPVSPSSVPRACRARARGRLAVRVRGRGGRRPPVALRLLRCGLFDCSRQGKGRRRVRSRSPAEAPAARREVNDAEEPSRWPDDDIDDGERRRNGHTRVLRRGT